MIHKLDKQKLALAQKLRRNEVKMIISNLFEKKKPVISFEIFPPKKEAELQNIDATLQTLATLHPDFISVTFGAGGSRRLRKSLGRWSRRGLRMYWPCAGM